MTDQQTSELAKAIQEVSEKASLLVREEIALAKAEMTEKLKGLARAAAAGVVAGALILFGLIYFFHFVALGLASLIGSGAWLGYLIVTGVVFLTAGLLGFLASRWVRKALPPAPTMAIEEAQLIKQTIQQPEGVAR